MKSNYPQSLPLFRQYILNKTGKLVSEEDAEYWLGNLVGFYHEINKDRDANDSNMQNPKAQENQ